MKAFAYGESYNKLPDSVIKNISLLIETPPSFATAMEYVKKNDIADWYLFDDLIKFLVTYEKPISEKGIAYLVAWKEIYSTKNKAA